MTPADLLHETVSALSSNKVRSGLTMLGIVIGISSVIAMVAIGQGAQSAITANIQSIGSNLIMVMPGSQRGPGSQVSGGLGSARSLTQADSEAITKEVSSIRSISPELSGRYQVVSRGKNTNTSVVGVLPAYPDVRNVQVEEGSFISDQQVRGLSKVVVLGPSVRDDLFGAGASAVGETVRIKNIQFTVIGVTRAKGGSGFGSQDDMAFIPLSSAQKFLAGDDVLSTISVQAQDVSAMGAIQQSITDLLLLRHRISDPQLADFRILNQADIVATASSVTQTFTILLGAVAGISLLVGGIGIMNMMLTTVTERTREIGLRKAIGARRKDISLQFLAESVALTFIGGMTGILLGWLVSAGISWFGVLQTNVTPGSILLAFGVSAGIGILFGYYPARRAAAMNPIEALRYE